MSSQSRSIGYARVSTSGQELEYQLDRLSRSGCTEIFREKKSGKDMERPELRRLLASLKPGDLVLATAIDRIARDPVDLLNIMGSVKAAGAAFRLLDEPFIDTASEMSDLVMFVVGWAARWQRKRILENTAQGREMARRRGVKFGRKPKLGPTERQKVSERRASGESCSAIARELGVSESTISRILIPF